MLSLTCPEASSEKKRQGQVELLKLLKWTFLWVPKVWRGESVPTRSLCLRLIMSQAETMPPHAP